MKTYRIETWLSDNHLLNGTTPALTVLDRPFKTDAAAKAAAFRIAKREGRVTSVSVDGKCLAVR